MELKNSSLLGPGGDMKLATSPLEAGATKPLIAINVGRVSQAGRRPGRERRRSGPMRGAGKNMQDHNVARVSYPVVGVQTANERSRGPPLAGEVMRWFFTGKGMLTYSPSIVAASVKVLEESATPDVQVTFAPGSFKNGQIGELEEATGLSAGAWQMRPLSRGYVEAKSNRPGDAPAINPRYLSEEADRRAIVGGLRLARQMFAAPALQQFVREGDPARGPSPDRRRIVRLRAPLRRHLLSRQRHLPDGFAPDERPRQRTACARHRQPPRHRSLGNAGGHLDQHQRANNHDRREGRGRDRGHRAAKIGGVGRKSGGAFRRHRTTRWRITLRSSALSLLYHYRARDEA